MGTWSCTYQGSHLAAVKVNRNHHTLLVVVEEDCYTRTALPAVEDCCSLGFAAHSLVEDNLHTAAEEDIRRYSDIVVVEESTTVVEGSRRSLVAAARAAGLRTHLDQDNKTST